MRRLGALLATAALVLTGCAGAPGREADGPTAEPAATTTTWIATAGDIACPPGQAAGGNTCRQAATARLILNVKKPYRVLTLGDNQYEDNTLWEYRNSYAKSWGLFYGKTWPGIGNHEYHTAGARGFFDYFHDRIPSTPGPAYYRQALNGWQIYVLNSNCSKISCTAERDWLNRAMNAHPSTCSLIAMHHPRYSSGYEHGNSVEAVGFWKIALAHRADVSLAGHDHDYERFVRMNNSAQYSPTGMVSYVVGTGGKNLYGLGTRKPGSRVFFNQRHGVLYLGLRPGGWSWEFRTIDNVVKDHGTGTCV